MPQWVREFVMQVRGSEFRSLAPTWKTDWVWVSIMPGLFQGEGSRDRKGPGSWWSTPWTSNAEDPVSLEKGRANIQGGPSDLHTCGPILSSVYKTLGKFYRSWWRHMIALFCWVPQNNLRGGPVWTEGSHFLRFVGIQEMESLLACTKPWLLTQEPHCKPIEIIVAVTNVLHLCVHVCVYTGECDMTHVWRSEDGWLQSVLSTKWVWGLGFGSSGLAASSFTHWPTHLPSSSLVSLKCDLRV